MGQPQFFEIKDEAIVTKILDVACRHKVIVTVWFKSQALKFETQISEFLVHLKRLYISLPKEISSDEFEKAIIKQGSPDLMASFQIETINFFLKTNFLTKIENSNLQIEVPKQIFKMQRRSHLRIPFSRHKAPRLEVMDPRKEFNPDHLIKAGDLLTFRILDVSVGGIAIAAKIEEKNLLLKGTKLYHMSFKIKGSEVIVNGIVKHAFETFNDQKKPILQVGIQFTTLVPKYEKIIAQFSLEESRKLFTLLY